MFLFNEKTKEKHNERKIIATLFRNNLLIIYNKLFFFVCQKFETNKEFCKNFGN
jgi:hypothetical protein